MSVKLVAIDIDGTLLDSNRKISPKVKETLQKANESGMYIVLCTGRPLPGVKEQLAELELYGDNDYVITYNGSLVQATKSNEIISQYTLSYDDFLEIELMSRKVGAHLHTIDDKAIYTANRDIGKYTVHEAYLVDMPLKYRAVDEMTPDMSIIKMMMIDEPEILDSAIGQLPEEFSSKYTTVKSTEFYYEILNKEASKGNALAKLAEHLGISQSETMAIGDNENDLSMIEYAGIGVAMGNATESVKRAADIQTTSNDEDGVAEVLLKYM
ncbi:cof-like hydrolase [Enterococcus haemoperoxidus ATCC BAA-382]|uniref:Cof-like hydrolase n=1 Tax=Enterococcus haemoperoxidus ATCC BAA-382 TaxID=1158608 RepID=R2STE6_9ENTE|nr:sugar-phosphatase [Enterococcus haemoperoxidus]EOH98490.1 cof-like hydrolase [Enterococcus haemoperoxidus ATCC BAA-382]EOT62327.1 HAD superfamily hydrolase [Enterococcus haemoperoxidus ATCC BAA-382]OJG55591.1 cof-like hydrolase [Enterococcus haemoperoxidus]